MLIAMLLMMIALAMIVPVFSVLVDTYSSTTRTLDSSSHQTLLSFTLDRVLDDAQVPPCPASSVCTADQATFLTCPDAMIFYSDAPMPGNPNGGAWVYLYLSQPAAPTLGASSPYAAYTLNIDEVVGPATDLPPFDWTGIQSGPLTTSNDAWSDCGPEQGTPTLTNTLLTLQSGYSVDSILTLNDVIAPAPGDLSGSYPTSAPSTTCMSAPTGPTCDPLVYYGLSSSTATVTNVAPTVAEVSYDITVRDLSSCSATCSSVVLDENSPAHSPAVTMQGTAVMTNVLINEGQGAGLF
jgi:hypothetical protein